MISQPRLYAKFSLRSSAATFDQVGGSGAEQTVIAGLGSAMELVICAAQENGA
jgi:hypothetical protein